jgi:hypothetical protein
MHQIGALLPFCEQGILVPQQESFCDALSMIPARSAGIVAPVRRIALRRYNFFLVKLNVPVQTPL